MLSAVAKLVIAALVSVHQYIPNEDTRYEKYFNDVREANEENIFPAAHESCRYLISVFVGAGLDSTLGGDNQNSVLSQTLVDLFASDQTFEWAMDLFEEPKYRERLENYEIDVEELKKVATTFCQETYKPFAFSPAQRKEVLDFIKKDIHILSPTQIKSLGSYKYFGSTALLDRYGVQLGTIDAVPRMWVPYHKISKNLILAVLATEDEDFFEHQGVDTKAIARIAKQVLSDSQATGGSTITMQLLKNMFFNHSPGSEYDILNSGQPSILLRKVREWYWAWPFEAENTLVMGDLTAKEYVLELYFNLVDFGPRIQGVGQAAYTYFNKNAEDLSIAESAFITTLLKAPSRYSNPDNYVEYTYPRRNNYVINRMKSLGLISEEQYQEAIQTDLPVWDAPTSLSVNNPSIYIRDHAREWLKSFDFPSSPQAKEIVVETSINKSLQNIVYEVAKENLDNHDEVRNRLNAVGPARDDRGRTARFREEDFSASFVSYLNRLQTLADTSDADYLISIYLGKAERQKLFYYHEDKLLQPELKLHKDIERLLKSKSSYVGEVILVRHKDDEVTLVDQILDSDLQTENTSLDFLEKLKEYKFINVRNSLNRLMWAKPRAEMEPVIYLEEDSGLRHRQGLVIQLTESHKNHFNQKKRSGAFEDGQIFWVKDSNPTPVQPLEDELIEDGLKAEGAVGEVIDAVEYEEKDPKDIVFELDTPKLQAAILVMDSNTGEVLANFGGYDPTTSRFDRSRFALRQAGSTLKPWVYFYALNRGFNPQDILRNSGVSFPIKGTNRIYRPKNYSSGVGSELSLMRALSQSQNIAALSLLQNPKWGNDWQQNLDELRDFFRAIDLYDSPIDSPAIVLGAQELAVANLVSSFSFFSNGKYIVKPQYFKYLTDSQGNIFYTGETEAKDVPTFKPSSVYQIQSLLVETANTGTAASLRNFTRNLAEGKYKDICFNEVIGGNKQSCFGGKTGTSNDSRDTWFIGFSKNFVIGIWVGYDYPRPLGNGATGSSIALPIFRGIIEKGETYLPEIQPIITVDDMPRDLERRAVYGNTACPTGQAGNAYIVYSDVYSVNNNCSTYRPRTLADCTCRRELYRGNDFDYYLDISYQGEKHPAFMSFETEGTQNDLINCERALAQVKNSEGQLVCVPQ